MQRYTNDIAQRRRCHRSYRHNTRKRIRARNRFLRRMFVFLLMVCATVSYVHTNGIADSDVEKCAPVHEAPPVAEFVSLPYIESEREANFESITASTVQYSYYDPSTPPLEEEDEPELPPEDIVVEEPTDLDKFTECMGDDEILLSNATLTKMATPDEFYPGIDYAGFQCYEDYRGITAKSSPAYKVTWCDQAFTDDNGFRRVSTNDSQFSVDGEADYMVAMGTFYKPKGTAGSRFLIVTDEGSFTVITGDEKADEHTDDYNMFTLHGPGKKYAAILEYMVNTSELPKSIRSSGNVHNSGISPIDGNIQMIYLIEE